MQEDYFRQKKQPWQRSMKKIWGLFGKLQNVPCSWTNKFEWLEGENNKDCKCRIKHSTVLGGQYGLVGVGTGWIRAGGRKEACHDGDTARMHSASTWKSFQLPQHLLGQYAPKTSISLCWFTKDLLPQRFFLDKEPTCRSRHKTQAGTFILFANICFPWKHFQNRSWTRSYYFYLFLPLGAINQMLIGMCAQSLQLCLTLCSPMNCSLPGSSVRGILQARILEWVAMPFSRESSRPRGQICVSYASCIGRWVSYH